MKKSNNISEQDLALFKNALNTTDGVTHQIKQDKIHFTNQLSKSNRQQKSVQRKTRQAGFYFSDEFEPNLPTQGPLRYVREGDSSFLAKQLRRGDFEPELILDLHGYNKEDAKLELAGLIERSQKEHIRCVCVVHGLGEFILKKKVPHYLVQHPAVVAFHQATKETGGRGALLVLIDVPER